MSETEPNPELFPVYSEVMEDYQGFSEALALTAGETAVVIASAGDNVLNAALEGGRHVFGVDVHPRQIEFCRLKEAAVARLSWRQLAQLIGVLEATIEERLEVLDQLPTAGLEVFQDPGFRQAVAAAGLAGCGHLTAFVAPLREGMRAAAGEENLERILTTAERAEREDLWQRFFATPQVEGLLAAALNEETIGDAFIPAWAFPRMAEQPFHTFYHGVLRHLLVDLDPTTNYFAHRIWRNRFPSPEAVPPYLREEQHARLRERLAAITWHQADLLGFLATLPASSVDVFNLSNILDWSDETHYEELWQVIDRTAAPGARVFLRSFLADRALPGGVVSAWRQDIGRSPAMAAADRVGYYSRYELWVHRSA